MVSLSRKVPDDVVEADLDLDELDVTGCSSMAHTAYYALIRSKGFGLIRLVGTLRTPRKTGIY